MKGVKEMPNTPTHLQLVQPVPPKILILQPLYLRDLSPESQQKLERCPYSAKEAALTMVSCLCDLNGYTPEQVKLARLKDPSYQCHRLSIR